MNLDNRSGITLIKAVCRECCNRLRLDPNYGYTSLPWDDHDEAVWREDNEVECYEPKQARIVRQHVYLSGPPEHCPFTAEHVVAQKP
jgi:hypothetical protein